MSAVLCLSIAGSYFSPARNAHAQFAPTPEGPPAPAELDAPMAAVVWPPDDAESAQIRHRVREAAALELRVAPEAVLESPRASARAVVTHEFDRAAGARLVAQEGQLAAALRAYRGARFGDAEVEISSVLASVRATPDLPGAAMRARSAHLLRARVAWSSGDRGAADIALRAALSLDPEAILSTRSVPPDLAARYAGFQAALLAERGSWPHLRVSVPPSPDGVGWTLEVDGVAGRRPVPAGMHFVVLRRAGYRPRGAYLSTEEEWTLPRAEPYLRDGQGDAFAVDPVEAQRLCDALGLQILLFADRRRKPARVGLQAYACGDAFGQRWIGAVEDVGEGARVALGGRFDRAVATLPEAWPQATGQVSGPLPAPQGLEDGAGPTSKPWYRRAWIWSVIGGAVVAGTTTGIILGTRDRGGGVRVNADDFAGK